MTLFNVLYENGTYKGSATVQARNASRVILVLRKYGRLNANLYRVISITDIGCNSSTEEALIQDSYGIEGEATSVVEQKFDVDSLSEEDIEKLKKKLNIKNYTLFVDRIGSINRPNPSDGYTVFVTHPKEKNSVLSDEVEGHIYTVSEGKYVDLGEPDLSILEIRSASKIIEYPDYRMRLYRRNRNGLNNTFFPTHTRNTDSSIRRINPYKKYALYLRLGSNHHYRFICDLETLSDKEGAKDRALEYLKSPSNLALSSRCSNKRKTTNDKLGEIYIWDFAIGIKSYRGRNKGAAHIDTQDNYTCPGPPRELIHKFRILCREFYYNDDNVLTKADRQTALYKFKNI